MKKNIQEPVQVVLTYKPNAEKDNFHAKLVTTTVVNNDAKLTKLDDNDKLVRRYSFDDNGGGYLGL
jgi:hypothetical protein